MKNKVPGKWARKFTLFMKINTLVLTMIWCSCLTALADNATGQDVLKKHLSISFKNIVISEALDQISAVSGVKFTYAGSVSSCKTKVSAAVQNKELKELLNNMLSKTPYNYEVLDGEILVKYNSTKQPALQRILSGKVIDEKGLPFPGVTVKVKGTNRGAVTDAKGVYQVQINDPTDLLVFSFVGYKPTEIAAENKETIDVQLVPLPANEMKEVAVVAYGSQRKISLVGAQSTVDVTELKNAPVASLSTLLAGRVAGIIGVQRSGEPGGDGSNIWIRGIASFAGTNSSPLILVDGVDRGNMDNLDPLDIQSFTILKDASATAVYGVRGANGVIIIQTKRGIAGKPQVNADYYEGIQTFTQLPKMADGATYLAAVNEANTTRGNAPIYSSAYIQNTVNKTDPLLYPDVDWIDAVFRKYAPTRRAHLTVSGGSPNATYYVSTGYQYTAGLLKTSSDQGYNIDDDYGRYNFTSNVNLQVTKTTKLDVGVQGFVYKGNSPSTSSGTIFNDAVSLPPTVFPTMYPGGFVPGINGNGGQPNPYAELTTTGYKRDFSYQLYSNIRLTQDLAFLTPGLSFSTMYAFDNSGSSSIADTKRENTYILDSANPYNADGSPNLDLTYNSGSQNTLSFSNSSGGYYQTYTESSLNYDRSFGKSRVGALALFTQDDKSYYPVNDITSSIPHRHRGLATRATYSFADKYFAEFNGGYNGSENFAPQNRYGFFPAFGVGWLVSAENFFKPLKSVVSFLKFRYSNGWVGSSDDGSRFAYLTFLSASHNGYVYGTNRNGISGIAIDQYGIDVTWSKSHKQDLGIDVKFLNDNLSVTADVFNEHRTGILIQRANVPGYVGIANLPEGNVGIVDNKGFDATIEDHLKFGDFNLNLSGNVTYSINKVIRNDQPTPPYPWMSQVGQPVLAQFGYIAEGLFTSQAEIDKSAVPGDKSQVLPGDIKYKDLNGDGVINAYDQTKISDGDVPKLMYGITLNASYKNFDIGAAFTGTGNADRYVSGSGIQPFSTSGGQSNAFSNITDRWTTENPSQNVFYPRLAYGDAANFNNTQTSTWWVKNTKFFRLKTVDIGYTLHNAFLKQAGVRSFRVYAMGYNLFTISKFNLWDPELNTGNGTVYPNVKTISFGFSVGF
ncbi:SusC/RagA family TonB-linked outer membrane protein [Mucilaginibacter paludis]|uniref:TonB-dependent receptor plug n=1 Tax=Mucilaginibacter paludis DSM 18603 TaxID=714943 RepID=H1Y4F2_9SPHI|nr:TonB-dependent receptor [Mucilaginibacter paludis]EHQ25786.1 TonB-dependent receptor plug [Mucilaginibacter paludis DSM 18603]